MKVDRQMSALERRTNDLEMWKLKLNEEKDSEKKEQIKKKIKICETDINGLKKNLKI
jgi:hypothetical protein